MVCFLYLSHAVQQTLHLDDPLVFLYNLGLCGPEASLRFLQPPDVLVKLSLGERNTSHCFKNGSSAYRATLSRSFSDRARNADLQFLYLLPVFLLLLQQFLLVLLLQLCRQLLQRLSLGIRGSLHLVTGKQSGAFVI